MLKRFTMGFVVGFAIMYYYLFYGPGMTEDAVDWGEKAAANYRGDQHHELADQLLKRRKERRARNH